MPGVAVLGSMDVCTGPGISSLTLTLYWRLDACKPCCAREPGRIEPLTKQTKVEILAQAVESGMHLGQVRAPLKTSPYRSAARYWRSTVQK